MQYQELLKRALKLLELLADNNNQVRGKDVDSLADTLGISKSAFSKLTTKMEIDGYIKKSWSGRYNRIRVYTILKSVDPELEDITKDIEQCKKYIEDLEVKLSNYNNFANDIADLVDNLNWM